MAKPVALFYIVCTICCANAISLSSLKELIVGGQLTKMEEVPYQAAVYFRDSYFCSGSIVTPTQIVTAAHCLIDLQDSSLLTVRVGSAKLHGGGQVAEVEKVTLHPKFAVSTLDYDVAVVELRRPLKLTKIVQPVPLGEKETKAGEEVRVSGWGFIKEIGPPSRRLRSAEVKVVDRKECARNYKDRFMVTRRMVCAALEGKDACYGDSGGPLVYEGKLVGIVSTGEGCARRDSPGIYTNIADREIRRFLRRQLSNSTQK